MKTPLKRIFRTSFLFHGRKTSNIGNTNAQIQSLNPNLAKITGFKLVIQHDTRYRKRVIPFHETLRITVLIAHVFRNSQETDQVSRFLPSFGESPTIHISVRIDILHFIRQCRVVNITAKLVRRRNIQRKTPAR